MGKKIVLHFINEAEAIKFKEAWKGFKSESYGSIIQKGKTCIIDYNCVRENKKVGLLPNSIFHGCQYCG